MKNCPLRSEDFTWNQRAIMENKTSNSQLVEVVIKKIRSISEAMSINEVLEHLEQH